jgi:hypothetical protein
MGSTNINSSNDEQKNNNVSAERNKNAYIWAVVSMARYRIISKAATTKLPTMKYPKSLLLFIDIPAFLYRLL